MNIKCVRSWFIIELPLSGYELMTGNEPLNSKEPKEERSVSHAGKIRWLDQLVLVGWVLNSTTMGRAPWSSV